MRVCGRRRCVVAAPAALGPDAAAAHGFAPDRGMVGGFLDGADVVLATPGLILPLAALGIALALGRPGDMRRAAPAGLAAALAGLVAAPVAGPWVLVAPLVLGLVVAAVAALAPPGRTGPVLPVLAALSGLGIVAAVFAGHGLRDVPHPVRVGVVTAVLAVPAAVRAVVQATRDAVPHPAATILWRIAASWIAAILVLFLALNWAA